MKLIQVTGEKGKAIVTIPSDQNQKQLVVAGLNIRLASMLTKYDIELIEIASIGASSNSNDKITVPEENYRCCIIRSTI